MTRQEILERMHRLGVRAALLAREAWRRVVPLLRAGWAVARPVLLTRNAATILVRIEKAMDDARAALPPVNLSTLDGTGTTAGQPMPWPWSVANRKLPHCYELEERRWIPRRVSKVRFPIS